MDSLALKRNHFFQNESNRKATHSFAPRPLIFKLQQEISEAVDRRCSVKKVFLEISQNSQENTCARVSFLIKLQTGLQLY